MADYASLIRPTAFMIALSRANISKFVARATAAVWLKEF